MLPSRSTTRLCGKSSTPAPKLLSSLPVESNSRTGASGLSAQELAPQRSATQMWPSRSRSTALVEPQTRPSGILKKFSTVRYGLGCELGVVAQVRGAALDLRLRGIQFPVLGFQQARHHAREGPVEAEEIDRGEGLGILDGEQAARLPRKIQRRS